MPAHAPLPDLLTGAIPLKDLPKEDLLNALKGKLVEVSFQTGEELSAQESLPPSLYLITEGSARALGSSDETPISLELMKPGSLVGWFSLATGIPCEWVRAATPIKALRIPADAFRKLLKDHPEWADSLRSKTSLAELFPLLRDLLKKRCLPVAAAKQIAIELLPQAAVLVAAPASDSSNPDHPSSIFQLPSSNGRSICVPSDLLNTLLEALGAGDSELRFDGTLLPQSGAALTGSLRSSTASVPTDLVQVSASDTQVSSVKFHLSSPPPPFHKASSPEDAILACLKMLAGQLDLPFRSEVIRSALKFHQEGRPALSFPRIGSVADMIGIATQPLMLPAQALRDQDAPFLMILGEAPVVVQAVSQHGLLIADPMAGEKPDQQKWTTWKDLPEPGEQGYPILLTRRSRAPKGEAFGFRSFLPYIRKHTRTFL
ncbi:MAG: cyclic nucleotide-binding domain-containing protein, partial [Verrucomicrobia bacterium]|nr:cyclic nucleotide-binding domain-containing protein [Verrucomicrobiota bacterium]